MAAPIGTRAATEAVPDSGIEEKRLPPRPRVTLQGVSWETYRALRDAEENAHVRMIYRSGTLDLMTTSDRHECYKQLLPYLVGAWCETKSIDCVSAGSTTRRRPPDAALEPDVSFFFSRARELLEQRRAGALGPDVGPSPELAVEIDLTTNSETKLAVYAALDVPEVWSFDGATATRRPTRAVRCPIFPLSTCRRGSTVVPKTSRTFGSRHSVK